VAKKKAAKEIKRLKKKNKEVTAVNLSLEKRVRKLEKKLGAREQKIADLQGRSKQAVPANEASKSPATPFGEQDDGSVASSQRAAWKRYSFLRDRYESHLAGGHTQQRARCLANEDLIQAYGTDCGYTEEELDTILS